MAQLNGKDIWTNVCTMTASHSSLTATRTLCTLASPPFTPSMTTPSLCWLNDCLSQVSGLDSVAHGQPYLQTPAHPSPDHCLESQAGAGWSWAVVSGSRKIWGGSDSAQVSVPDSHLSEAERWELESILNLRPKKKGFVLKIKP